MKQRSALLFFVFLFWTIFFVVTRGIFLLYFAEARSALSFSEMLAVFNHGLAMDLSAAAYLTAFTGILLALLYFNTGIQLWPVWIMFHMVAVVGASLVTVYDLAVYPVWQYRLDVRALTEIDMQLINRSPQGIIVLVAIFLLLVGCALFVSYRFFWPRFYSLRATSLATMPVILALTALLVVPMRGSLGVVTMNPSFAYSHSLNAFANHAGINVSWNFANSLGWRKQTVASTGSDHRDVLTETIFAQPDSTAKLIDHKRPNIVIILLDRLPADLVGVLGGRKDATPHFNELAAEGILFDQFYSNSNQTDKGLAAILNGYPSQSRMSTMSDTRRAQGLPYLNKVFKSQGYTTGFTHGGWPNYNNLRAYLFAAGFDSVTHADNFVAERRSGKWGVPDEFVFDKFSDEIFHDRQPFFRVMMTNSTRSPQDAPAHDSFKGSEQSGLLSAIHYTDQELGKFVQQAKKTLWWDNTLIIITSDQGNAANTGEDGLTPAQFKIPMLWLGGALATRDTVIHTLGNQTDICNTLLAQIGQYSKDFAFSRDIASPGVEQLAMFVFDNGFGVVKPYGAGIFGMADDRVIYSERVNKAEADQGRAYLNAVRSDYASR